jgi:hypothetical protein
MEICKAYIKTTPTGSQYTVTVEAGAGYVARQEIEKRYAPIYIYNLRQVRESSSSSSSSSSSIGGTVVLVGLIAAAWAFVSFTPWILMGLGGIAGTWVGEKVTGQSIEDYNDREDDRGHKRVAIVIALALFLGGLGFVKGSALKKDFDSDSPSSVPTTTDKRPEQFAPNVPLDSSNKRKPITEEKPTPSVPKEVQSQELESSPPLVAPVDPDSSNPGTTESENDANAEISEPLDRTMGKE